jgi:hypothetical protein
MHLSCTGVDLGVVEPGCTLPSDAEKGVEEEDHCDGGSAVFVGLRVVVGELVEADQEHEDEVADEAARGTDEHCAASSPFVD